MFCFFIKPRSEGDKHVVKATNDEENKTNRKYQQSSLYFFWFEIEN